MTIQEMHIQFDQGVQYINSRRSRGFYPEEKDLILNKAINRYIISRLRPKPEGSFEMDTLAAEQLKTLIAEATIIPNVLPTMYSFQLPSDLGWFVAAGAQVSNECKPELAKTSTITKTIQKLPIALSTKANPKYYVTAQLGNVNLTAIGIGSTWTGTSTKEQIFEVYPHLIGALRKTMPVYIEDGFMYIHGDSPISLTIDSVVTNSTANTVEQKYYSLRPTSLAPIRVAPSVSFFDMQASSYYKSSGLSPLGTLRNNFLLVRTGSYIITSGDVFYVRKPTKVSLPLGISCNLPEEYHDEVVDLAVSYTKSELNSPDWERKIQDLKLNTTV